jgi:hypothetical protein
MPAGVARINALRMTIFLSCWVSCHPERLVFAGLPRLLKKLSVSIVSTRYLLEMIGFYPVSTDGFKKAVNL